MVTEVINQQIDAPVYFGGEEHSLWFMDKEYNRARDEFDDNIMDALIAVGIGENICPMEGQWVQFCIINAIIFSVGGHVFLPSISLSLEDVEKESWKEMWHHFKNYNLASPERIFNPEFVGSLLRIFIPRYHDVDVRDRPFTRSHFVDRWGFSFNTYPDSFNDKTCNVRLRHLKRGREVMRTFSEKLASGVQSVCLQIPLILKDVNAILNK